MPREIGGRALRHAVEVRHESFSTPAFIALLRRFGVAVVFAEHATYPALADVTSDFVYARLQKGKDTVKTGYAPKALDAWSRRVKLWAAGDEPKDLDRADAKTRASKAPRDVFVYFINEGKVRAPAAAMALMERVKG